MNVFFHSRLRIGGAWSGVLASAPVINPFTGQEFARVPPGGVPGIQRRIAALRVENMPRGRCEGERCTMQKMTGLKSLTI